MSAFSDSLLSPRLPMRVPHTWLRVAFYSLTAVVLLALTGCAGLARNTLAEGADPLEPMNRAVFKFNTAVDDAAVKPIARAYTTVVPSPARSCISGVFSNLYEPVNVLNNFLQGKAHAAVNSFGRFTMNSFVGLGGCIDVAYKQGLESSNEDFGQTLGRWGVKSGPYIVIPFLGPTTVRDFSASFADNRIFYPTRIPHILTRNATTALRLINVRSETLGLTNQMDSLALDRYSFYRDSYLQRRKNAIFDGQVPEDEEVLPKAKEPGKADNESAAPTATASKK